MARDQETLEIGNSWTQLTNADASSITFQVVEGMAYIRATTDGTAPDSEDSGMLYEAPAGEAKVALSDMVALSGAARIWARSASSDRTKVFVDHADA